jgi:phosphatidylglycerol:prolipoprotein diacylglycerol transferase
MIEFPNLGLELNIGRVAFTVFGIDIFWYAIVITISIILAFLYAAKRSGQFGLISDKVFDAALVGLLGGFLGARLYFVIFSSESYRFIEIFTRIRDGGLAMYGGVIGAVLFGYVYMKLKKFKIKPVLDLAGLGFLIGIGLGRWGNFFNQEAYGSETSLPWGMTGNRIANSVGENVLVHPCFLYESLWCLFGFVLLHFYSKKLRTFDGEIALLSVAWYGLGRAFNEQLRTDSLMLGDFKVSQLLASISAGAAIGAFIYFKRKAAKNPAVRLYRDTVESAVAISEHKKELKLRKEKADAKKALKEETAPSILLNDETEEKENGEDS